MEVTLKITHVELLTQLREVIIQGEVLEVMEDMVATKVLAEDSTHQISHSTKIINKHLPKHMDMVWVWVDLWFQEQHQTVANTSITQHCNKLRISILVWIKLCHRIINWRMICSTCLTICQTWFRMGKLKRISQVDVQCILLVDPARIMQHSTAQA